MNSPRAKKYRRVKIIGNANNAIYKSRYPSLPRNSSSMGFPTRSIPESRLIGIAVCLFILLGLFTSRISAQDSTATTENHFIAIQTGFSIDNNNSFGVRLYLEFQKEWTPRWSYGVSFEGTAHFGEFATDTRSMPTSLNHLLFNVYYRVNLNKDKIYWDCGLGLGGSRAFWSVNNKFGLTSSASITLNIRLGPNVLLQASPLVILAPVNRAYASKISMNENSRLWAFAILPFGVKIRV